MKKKTIVILLGSIKADSSNQQLADWIKQRTKDSFDWQLSIPLHQLPFFNPDLDGATIKTALPPEVVQFREQLAKADGILVVSPEYVFSLPGVLKNALEWLVSTTLLTDKPTGMLIAAASGEKAQDQLALILNTLGATTKSGATILIKGIKGKIQEGTIKDANLIKQLDNFTQALYSLIKD